MRRKPPLDKGTVFIQYEQYVPLTHTKKGQCLFDLLPKRNTLLQEGTLYISIRPCCSYYEASPQISATSSAVPLTVTWARVEGTIDPVRSVSQAKAVP